MKSIKQKSTVYYLGDFLHDPLDCLEDGGLLQQQDGVRLDPVSLKQKTKT
jgi:hypothetical protein